MTILWPFSYNSLVKFHGTKNYRAHNRIVIYQNLSYSLVCYKGTALQIMETVRTEHLSYLYSSHL